MTDHTHTITVTVHGRNSLGPDERVEVATHGDGDFEHYMQTLAATLVAAGFSPETAAMLLALKTEA